MTVAAKLTNKQRKELFLKKYEYYGAVWPACRAAGIKSRKTPYNWCEADKEFASAFEEIQARVEDDLASRLILATRGKVKMDADQIRASIFTLKALNPTKYAEKYQVGGKDGGPLEVDVDVKGKLISLLDSIATRSGTTESDTEPQPEGSGGASL